VQWTRLPAGETPAEFVRRIQQLLSSEVGHSTSAAYRPAAMAAGKSSRLKPAWMGVIVALLAVGGYVLVQKFWITNLRRPSAFSPPLHSVAVLPLINMTGDKQQEYFSDGLTEEMLNSLARINELQVSARTSSFSFKGKDADIGTIARKLNVGAVLEGSVRRSGQTVRITAELISGVTGFHIWSETYDRNVGEILALQSGIANAVASSLNLAVCGATQ
jgi:TolB-like protein